MVFRSFNLLLSLNPRSITPDRGQATTPAQGKCEQMVGELTDRTHQRRHSYQTTAPSTKSAATMSGSPSPSRSAG